MNRWDAGGTWKSIIIKKSNPDSPSTQETSDSGRQQRWWQRLPWRKNQGSGPSTPRATSAPFKESTQIDENAEASAPPAGARPDASGNPANDHSGDSERNKAGQSNNGGRNGGGSSDSGRKPNDRTGNTGRRNTGRSESPNRNPDAQPEKADNQPRGRSENTGRNPDAQAEKADSKPRGRSESTGRNPDAQAEKTGDKPRGRTDNTGRNSDAQTEKADRKPRGRSRNTGQNSDDRSPQAESGENEQPETPKQNEESRDESTSRSRTPRKEAEREPQVTLEEADSYWFGSQEVSRDVALALKAVGYENPTPIQTDCIGPLLDGSDVVGQAHTGTGKTAAFGIPMVERVDPSKNIIQGLVLVPTRELAMQVRDEIARLGQFRKLGVVACYGGQPIARQITALNRNAQIVVGTPGRILDHIGRGTLQLGEVRSLVLDEADEMLDIGFLPDIERILRSTPKDRQSALFSATLPPAIRGIVGRHMKSPTWIRIGNEIETAPDVRQIYYEVLETDRVRACVALLKNHTNDGKVLLFRRTKAGVDNLTQALQRQGISAMGIHGGLVQGERNAAMKSFHAGDIKVLVATNVAARGLDIPEISHVVNYDMPQNLEEYVHRIGRTARMGRHGVAITFVSEWDFEILDLLQESLGEQLTLEKFTF